MKGLVNNRGSLLILQDKDLINASLERLFFTGIGGCIGSLDKGSRIPDYLDTSGNEANALAILHECEVLVDLYEPRIVLDDIAIDLTPDGGTIGVVLYTKWHFVNDKTEQNESIISKVFVIS